MSTSIITTIEDGRAPAPFALVDVGNPEWWKCPKCDATDIPQALWWKCGLYGFRCHHCDHVWHYATIIIQRRDSSA